MSAGSVLENKRIAIVRARYNPYGGAERFVARALLSLQNTHTELTIIARRWQGKKESSSAVHRAMLNPLYIGSIWRDASFARSVLRHIEKNHYDLVQSHERIPGLDIYRAGDGVHREWLAQRARTLPWWRRLGVWCNPYHAYIKRKEAEMFAHPDLRAVICNSRMVQQEIQDWFKLPADKLHVIYNGVDTMQFHPRVVERRERMRGQWNVPVAAFCFLFLGSGFERKGLSACLHALADLPTAWLMVVGHDKHQKRYEKLARQLRVEGRVIFAGAQQEVLPFYGMADAFVLPTLYDPFPNAVLEAMACGLPVITSTKSGVAELIKNGQHGMVVEADQPVRLAHAMTSVMRPGLAESMGKNARALAEQYDLSLLGQQLTHLYTRLVTHPA